MSARANALKEEGNRSVSPAGGNEQYMLTGRRYFQDGDYKSAEVVYGRA